MLVGPAGRPVTPQRLRPTPFISRREAAMEFGYFTLSDNHYENNPRTSNQFVTDITDEALYADELCMHSIWIGEFSSFEISMNVFVRSSGVTSTAG